MRTEPTILALFLCLGMVLMGTAALAQPVDVTAAQAELNNEGVAAVNDGDYDKAIKLFRGSLELGELNITWLNLGRAYQKAGLCDEAIEAYDRTLSTEEKVADPEPEAIKQAVTRFRGELSATCPGKVRFVCAPADLQLVVDDGEPGPCPEDPLVLPPGEYTFEALIGDQRTTKIVKVVALKSVEVSLTITPLLETNKGKGEGVGKKDPVEGSSALSTTGWAVLGVGGALLATALVVDAAIISPDIDRLETLREDPSRADDFETLKSDIEGNQDLNIVLLMSGMGLAVLGGAFLLVDALDDDERSKDTGSLRPWVAPGAAGMGWTSSW